MHTTRSQDTTPNGDSEYFWANRAFVVASLLVEAEADLMAAMGRPREDITPERIQDACIGAINQVINNVSFIVVKGDHNEEGANANEPRN